MNWLAILREVQNEVTPLLGQGQVAEYIPALAKVDPMQFGMAITFNNGQFFGVGAYKQPFSIQSISKVFSYTLALKEHKDELFKRVWREPSGNPFNSLVQLEYEAGIPRNPFINAGAIVVSDSLLSLHKNENQTVRNILDFIQQCSNDYSIAFDADVADSEKEHGFRNAALASLMKALAT